MDNWMFNDATVATGGGSADLRVECDPIGSGKAKVHHAVLPTPKGSASFGTIASGLAALGYDDPQVKWHGTGSQGQHGRRTPEWNSLPAARLPAGPAGPEGVQL